MVPDNATLAPSIVTVDALVELQVSVELAPGAMLVGSAVRMIVGGVLPPPTVTVVDAEALPPVPVAEAV